MAKAHVYAMAAHASVRGKLMYTGEPHVVHLAEVAQRVAAIPGATEDMVAAAWLHDVVKHTGCTSTDIHIGFGADISRLVGWLTNARERGVEGAPPEVQSILCAELISNIRLIAGHDPEFGRVWFPEQRSLLENVTKADPGILDEAHKLLDEAIAHVDSIHNGAV